MANSRGTTNLRNSSCIGKQSFLPPKSPFRNMPPYYADYGSSLIGSKGIPKPKDGHRHHQRTSSESFLVEEQFSWLDDLLNEPETPVKRGTHRRSSSDSFAYLEASSNYSNVDNIPSEQKHRNLVTAPSWGSLDLDCLNDVHHSSLYSENSSEGQQNIGWESPYPSSHLSARDNALLQGTGSLCAPVEPDAVPSTAAKKEDQDESAPHDPHDSSERSDGSHSKPSASEADPKRARQRFAQRSRVRKLQYIADLERNVQGLQAEGSEVLAELGFLEQQHLILNMENKALKQRLDSLAQEKLVKYFEQEVLEREIARLRALIYQQQQQQQQIQQQQQQHPLSIHHRRRSSGDLDTQFASLSLKHDANSAREPVSGPLHT